MIRTNRAIFLILVFLSTVVSNANSQNKFYLKLGGNITNLRHEDITNNRGLSFGLGYEFNPIRSLNTFIALEILYATRNGTLFNKTWPVSFYDYSEVIIGDINIDIRVLEIPIKFGYFFSINKKTKLKMFMGPSITRRLVNKTKHKYKGKILLDQGEEYKFDYFHYDADPTNFPASLSFLSYKTGLDFNLGTGLKISFIDLEFRYSYSLIETKNIIGLNLFGHFDSYILHLNIDL